MEGNKNKYIAVSYKLFTVDGELTTLVEEATEEQPFQFISGFGIALDAFEKNVEGLDKGSDFNFTLTKDEAYGDYLDEHVLDLGREVFSINGHFDHEHIYKGAVIPLQNEDGNRFLGRILDVKEDTVKVDLNPPLAGKNLKFQGKIIESREATNDEIQGMINRMSGERCGCGCPHDGDEGGCCCGGHEHKHDHSCHHDHHEGGCCCGGH